MKSDKKAYLLLVLVLFNQMKYPSKTAMQARPTAIPQFGLYGEHVRQQEPGFVHIEDIATRSSEHGWLISPHRHVSLFQAICVFAGEVDITLDERSYFVSDSCVITLPTGVVHGFKFAPETKGVVLSIAEPRLVDVNSSTDKVDFQELLIEPQVIEFEPQQQLLDELKTQLSLLRTEISRTDMGHELMLDWFVNAVLMTIKRQLQQQDISRSQHSAKKKLLSEFKALLNQYYQQQLTVKEYAQALHISVSSLDRLCQQVFACTAKSIIQERQINEIKRRLMFTSQSAKEIAYAFGFKDPAYFSRFFRRQTNMSPSEYRQQMH